jgi:hypothetical protein
MPDLHLPVWVAATHYVALLFASGEWRRLVIKVVGHAAEADDPGGLQVSQPAPHVRGVCAQSSAGRHRGDRI